DVLQQPGVVEPEAVAAVDLVRGLRRGDDEPVDGQQEVDRGEGQRGDEQGPPGRRQAPRAGRRAAFRGRGRALGPGRAGGRGAHRSSLLRLRATALRNPKERAQATAARMTAFAAARYRLAFAKASL